MTDNVPLCGTLKERNGHLFAYNQIHTAPHLFVMYEKLTIPRVPAVQTASKGGSDVHMLLRTPMDLLTLYHLKHKIFTATHPLV